MALFHSPQPHGLGFDEPSWFSSRGEWDHGGDHHGRSRFEDAARDLGASILHAASTMSIGFDAQSIWSCHGRAMAQELRQHAGRRWIGWFEAASHVRLARMLTFRSEQECIRANGRGPSTALEPQRQTFGSLVIEAATQLFGRHADFSALTEAQQNRVYAEIIVAAACSNQQAMSAMRDFTEAGRKFVIVGQAISVYRLAVGADKMRDFGNSGARGSVAGHVFDTPIDVPTVAFISGALAELGSGMGRFIPRANGGGGGGSSSVDMIPKDGYAPAPPRQMSSEGFRGRVADALDSVQASEFGKIAQGWPVEGVIVGSIKGIAVLGVTNRAMVKGAFATESKLVSHFEKHGMEFGAKNAEEYLKIGQDIISNGIPVKYLYNGENRIGYLQLMGNSAKVNAKFGFVGTNAEGAITTIHTQSGSSFWKMLNGNPMIKNIEPLP